MKKITRSLSIITTLLVAIVVVSCVKPDTIIEPANKLNKIFVINEGKYGDNNADISAYDPTTNDVVVNLYKQANNKEMGDVPTSISYYYGRAYVTLSNSGTILVLDPTTGKQIGKIDKLDSPRYMVAARDEVVYVSSLKGNKIYVINLVNNTIDKEITLYKKNVEQFIKIGEKIYANCWSFGNEILKINTKNDNVEDSVKVGIQPRNLSLDSKGRLWTMTDGGGWDGNPIGYENPALVCVDANLNVVAKHVLTRKPNDSGLMAMANGTSTIYYQNGDIYKFDINSPNFEPTLFLEAGSKLIYSLGVDPINNDLYLGDAVDYTSQGMVYRYNKDGKLINNFNVGVCPGGFSFYITW